MLIVTALLAAPVSVAVVVQLIRRRCTLRAASTFADARTPLVQAPFDMAVDMLTGEGGGGAVTPGRRGRSHRRLKSSGSAAGSHHSHTRSAQTYRTGGHVTPRGARSTRSARSGVAAGGVVAPGYENTPLPRSILEQPIADPARDAYYGGGLSDDDTVSASTPSRAKAAKKAAEGPGGPRSASRKRGGGGGAVSGGGPRSSRGPTSANLRGRGGSYAAGGNGNLSPSAARAVAHAQQQALLANGGYM
jgi:hypothetical protein